MTPQGRGQHDETEAGGMTKHSTFSQVKLQSKTLSETRTSSSEAIPRYGHEG